MAFASLGVLLFVCVGVYLEPSHYEHEVVRFVFCFLLTLCLSVFFFIFWPQELKLTQVPVINLSVTVAGPVVLWLILFLLFLQVMPPSIAGKQWEFFTPINEGGSKASVLYHSTISVRAEGKESVPFRLVPETKDATLRGIFIQFRAGEDQIKAILVLPNRELPVTFKRGAGTFDVSGLME
jgi:hypothetical protein